MYADRLVLGSYMGGLMLFHLFRVTCLSWCVCVCAGGAVVVAGQRVHVGARARGAGGAHGARQRGQPAPPAAAGARRRAAAGAAGPRYVRSSGLTEILSYASLSKVPLFILNGAISWQDTVTPRPSSRFPIIILNVISVTVSFTFLTSHVGCHARNCYT